MFCNQMDHPVYPPKFITNVFSAECDEIDYERWRRDTAKKTFIVTETDDTKMRKNVTCRVNHKVRQKLLLTLKFQLRFSIRTLLQRNT